MDDSECRNHRNYVLSGATEVLSESLEPSLILRDLVTNHVFTDDDVRDVKSHARVADQVSRMLELLKRMDDRAYQVFMRALLKHRGELFEDVEAIERNYTPDAPRPQFSNESQTSSAAASQTAGASTSQAAGASTSQAAGASTSQAAGGSTGQAAGASTSHAAGDSSSEQTDGTSSNSRTGGASHTSHTDGASSASQTDGARSQTNNIWNQTNLSGHQIFVHGKVTNITGNQTNVGGNVYNYYGDVTVNQANQFNKFKFTKK